MKKIKIGIFGPKGRMGESIIKQIDNPANTDLLQMIESIDVSEQTVKIIIKSELRIGAF